MEVFTIKKGDHYSSGIHFGLNLTNFLSRECVFDESCCVDSGTTDLNKLFGFSNGYHLSNSARIGWRYNPTTRLIDLYCYMHIDGAIFSIDNLPAIYLCSVAAGDKFVANVQAYYAGDQYNFEVYYADIDSPNYVNKHFTMGKKAWKYGYYLYPYYGGTETAPQTMKITIE